MLWSVSLCGLVPASRMPFGRLQFVDDFFSFQLLPQFILGGFWGVGGGALF